MDLSVKVAIAATVIAEANNYERAYILNALGKAIVRDDSMMINNVNEITYCLDDNGDSIVRWLYMSMNQADEGELRPTNDTRRVA